MLFGTATSTESVLKKLYILTAFDPLSSDAPIEIH